MRKALSYVFLGALLVVASCSGDSGTGPSSGTTMTAGEIHKVVVDAGFSCNDVVQYEPSEEDISLGIDPNETFECDYDEGEFAVAVWDDAAGRTAAFAVMQAFICGFGGEMGMVNGSNWMLMMEPSDEETATMTAEDIASSIGIGEAGEECPEGSGPSWGDLDGDIEFGSETESSESESATNRDNPATAGTTLDVEEWTVTLNHFSGDLTTEVAAANEFHQPATDGNIYVGVNITLTYNGESSATGNNLSFSYLGSSGVAQRNTTISDGPDALDLWAEVYTGATLEGNVFFEIEPNEVDGALLVVEPAISFGDTKEFFELD